MQLTPGKALIVEFEDEVTADKARTEIREYINLHLGGIFLRTRKLMNENGLAEIHFVKIHSVS